MSEPTDPEQHRIGRFVSPWEHAARVRYAIKRGLCPYCERAREDCECPTEEETDDR
jgi:hypothetical protein